MERNRAWLTSSTVARIAKLWGTGSLDRGSPETLRQDRCQMSEKTQIFNDRQVRLIRTKKRIQKNKLTHQCQHPLGSLTLPAVPHQSDRRTAVLETDLGTYCSLRCTCWQTFRAICSFIHQYLGCSRKNTAFLWTSPNPNCVFVGVSAFTFVYLGWDQVTEEYFISLPWEAIWLPWRETVWSSLSWSKTQQQSHL